MKKILFYLIIIVIILSIIFVKYKSYRNEISLINKENAEYEKYKDQEIYGIEIATLINKTIDKNSKNQISKDEKGMYISNNKNSIQIEIYIQDNDTTYKMETFYNSGTENFINYYGNIKFKCSKIEYHENTKKIKYILFEQI